MSLSLPYNNIFTKSKICAYKIRSHRIKFRGSGSSLLSSNDLFNDIKNLPQELRRSNNYEILFPLPFLRFSIGFSLPPISSKIASSAIVKLVYKFGINLTNARIIGIDYIFLYNRIAVKASDKENKCGRENKYQYQKERKCKQKK